jgi:hypothetical protein
MGSPNAGDLILAGTAIFAAATAAWTANRRMERQLAEEAERLAHQLAHDRRIREAEELRSVLDDACRSLAQAIEAVSGSRSHRELAPLMEGENSPDKESWRRERETLWHDAMAKTVSLVAEVQRLRLRFGDKHPVTATYDELRGILLTTVAADRRIKLPIEDDPFTQVGPLNVQFVEACRPYVRVEELEQT